jgi:hypothetical protein
MRTAQVVARPGVAQRPGITARNGNKTEATGRWVALRVAFGIGNIMAARGLNHRCCPGGAAGGALATEYAGGGEREVIANGKSTKNIEVTNTTRSEPDNRKPLSAAFSWCSPRCSGWPDGCESPWRFILSACRLAGMLNQQNRQRSALDFPDAHRLLRSTNTCIKVPGGAGNMLRPL